MGSDRLQRSFIHLIMLTNDNFLHYAMTNYDNHHCKTAEEFNDDLSKITHIKRWLTRIVAGEDVNYRLMLNHFIVFYNVFKSDAATAILFFKIEKDKWVMLNTFLVYLNYSPKFIEELGISLYDVGVDKRIFSELSKI